MLLAGGNVKHHGASPWPLANPIDQPVFVAVNMKHHRASLWYRLPSSPFVLYLLFLGALVGDLPVANAASCAWLLRFISSLANSTRLAYR